MSDGDNNDNPAKDFGADPNERNHRGAVFGAWFGQAGGATLGGVFGLFRLRALLKHTGWAGILVPGAVGLVGGALRGAAQPLPTHENYDGEQVVSIGDRAAAIGEKALLGAGLGLFVMPELAAAFGATVGSVGGGAGGSFSYHGSPIEGAKIGWDQLVGNLKGLYHFLDDGHPSAGRNDDGVMIEYNDLTQPGQTPTPGDWDNERTRN